MTGITSEEGAIKVAGKGNMLEKAYYSIKTGFIFYLGFIDFR